MIWGVILDIIIYFFVEIIFTAIWAIIMAIYNAFIWIINLFKTLVFSIFGEISEKNEKKDLDSKSETSDELGYVDGKHVVNVINASKTRDEDVFKLLVGFSVTLVSAFVLAVVLLWLFVTMNGGAFGFNPPQSLVTWEDEYKDMTGINNIEGLDGTGISLCIVDSGIDLSLIHI